MRLRHLVVLGLVVWLSSVAAAGERIVQIDSAGLADVLEARQGRVVLVSFWATWCRPCLEEIPALIQLREELGPRGFDLIAVSVDDPDSQTTVVEPFMRKWFPDFESYLSVEYAMDEIVGVIDPFWNEVLPTNYIIAPDGSVAKRMQGGSTADEFAAAIEPLLD